MMMAIFDPRIIWTTMNTAAFPEISFLDLHSMVQSTMLAPNLERMFQKLHHRGKMTLLFETTCHKAITIIGVLRREKSVRRWIGPLLPCCEGTITNAIFVSSDLECAIPPLCDHNKWHVGRPVPIMDRWLKIKHFLNAIRGKYNSKPMPTIEMVTVAVVVWAAAGQALEVDPAEEVEGVAGRLAFL